MFVKGLKAGEVDFCGEDRQSGQVPTGKHGLNITFHVGNRARGSHSTCLQDASTPKREEYTCMTFLKESFSFF